MSKTNPQVRYCYAVNGCKMAWDAAVRSPRTRDPKAVQAYQNRDAVEACQNENFLKRLVKRAR